MAEKLEKLEKKLDEKLTAAEMYAQRPRKWWLYLLIVLRKCMRSAPANGGCIC